MKCDQNYTLAHYDEIKSMRVHDEAKDLFNRDIESFFDWLAGEGEGVKISHEVRDPFEDVFCDEQDDAAQHLVDNASLAELMYHLLHSSPKLAMLSRQRLLDIYEAQNQKLMGIYTAEAADKYEGFCEDTADMYDTEDFYPY